jgi:prepilin peptidase CpaA
MLIEVIRLTLFPAMMAFAASSDLFTMTIANRVSLILLAAAVLVAAFLCFTCGWIGGGDAKLAATTVLWLGVGHLADYLIYASLLGGALTLLLIQYRALPMPQILLGREWAERLHRPDCGVPYGIALAVAALVVYPQTEWMTALGL